MKHQNLVSKQEDLFIDSKKSSRSWKPTIHNIISNWSSARHQILEKEMSCNLFSDLSVTNIRIHIWTTSKSDWVPNDMRVMKESWDWLVLTWGDTQLFMQGKLWHDLFTLKDSSLQGYAHWITIGWINNQCQNISWGVSRSLILEVSSIKTTPRKLISKKHQNLVSKKEDLFIDSKKSSRSWKPTIHKIISNWSSARHQILEKEMSCNLFSDVSVTNIRIHIWTKSSLRARATEYQMIWESWKKVEIGWFWREATPNYSCKGNFGMTCLH